MLSGSRFVCEFNIQELQTGQLVCSRDFEVIKGISWCLCVRRSMNKINTGVREDVIRTKDELLGLPLIIPRKDNPFIESSRKFSRVRSKKRVHFVDESTDSENEDHEFQNSLKVHRTYPERINSRNGSLDDNFNNRSKANSSSDSDDNFRDSNSDLENQYPRNSQERQRIQSKYFESQTSSDSQESPACNPHSFRSSRMQTGNRQNDCESTRSSETESDDPRDRPRNLQLSSGEISKGRSRSSRNRRYGRTPRGDNSKDDKKLTSLDFYLKLEENGNKRLKQCTTNFTLDLVNKNRGMRKIRKYRYQTFFPDDVSGWTNVITWNDLTNRDNCFVDKNGYFQIEAAVLVLNTKMLIERIQPEKLETIV